MAVIEQILEQHAEETAFLWLIRDAAVRAPHYSLKDLSKLEGRIEAHLDGLRIAGDPGWDAVARELSWKEPGEIFAAAVLAFETGGGERIEALIDAATRDRSLERAMVSALGWLPFERAERFIRSLLVAADPTRRAIGVRAGAVHRWPETLRDAPLADADAPVLRIARLRASGELGRRDSQRARISTDDPDVQFWSVWANAMLGDTAAPSRLTGFVVAGGSHCDRALEIAGRAMSMPDVHRWIQDLCTKPETVLYAVRLAGILGDPARVPWLIEQMAVPEFARAAGESFVSITGANLDDGLEGVWPEGFQRGPSEDSGDEEVSIDPDEDLLWPQLAAVEEWWNHHRHGFVDGHRFILGRRLSESTAAEILRTGSQRQRAAVAIELKLRRPDQPLFEVRAPAIRQDRQLASK